MKKIFAGILMVIIAITFFFACHKHNPAAPSWDMTLTATHYVTSVAPAATFTPTHTRTATVQATFTHTPDFTHTYTNTGSVIATNTPYVIITIEAPNTAVVGDIITVNVKWSVSGTLSGMWRLVAGAFYQSKGHVIDTNPAVSSGLPYDTVPPHLEWYLTPGVNPSGMVTYRYQIDTAALGDAYDGYWEPMAQLNAFVHGVDYGMNSKRVTLHTPTPTLTAQAATATATRTPTRTPTTTPTYTITPMATTYENCAGVSSVGNSCAAYAVMYHFENNLYDSGYAGVNSWIGNNPQPSYVPGFGGGYALSGFKANSACLLICPSLVRRSNVNIGFKHNVNIALAAANTGSVWSENVLLYSRIDSPLSGHFIALVLENDGAGALQYRLSYTDPTSMRQVAVPGISADGWYNVEVKWRGAYEYPAAPGSGRVVLSVDRIDSSGNVIQHMGTSVYNQPMRLGEPMPPVSFCVGGNRSGFTEGSIDDLYITECDSPVGTVTATFTSVNTPQPTATYTAVATATNTPASGFALRVNCNDTQWVDSNGDTWLADQMYNPAGGNHYGWVTGTRNTWYDSSQDITGTIDDRLYYGHSFGWAGNLSYVFEVPNGVYSVTMKFVEVGWTTTDTRVFDIYMENNLVVNDLDIWQRCQDLYGKPEYQAYDITINNVTVSDGALNLDGYRSKDTAMFCAVAIVGAGGTPVPTATPTFTHTVIPTNTNTATFTNTGTNTPTSVPTLLADCASTTIACYSGSPAYYYTFDNPSNRAEDSVSGLDGYLLGTLVYGLSSPDGNALGGFNNSYADFNFVPCIFRTKDGAMEWLMYADPAALSASQNVFGCHIGDGGGAHPRKGWAVYFEPVTGGGAGFRLFYATTAGVGQYISPAIPQAGWYKLTAVWQDVIGMGGSTGHLELRIQQVGGGYSQVIGGNGMDFGVVAPNWDAAFGLGVFDYKIDSVKIWNCITGIPAP